MRNLRFLLIGVQSKFAMSNVPQELVKEIPSLNFALLKEPDQVPKEKQKFPRAPKFLKKGARVC